MPEHDVEEAQRLYARDYEELISYIEEKRSHWFSELHRALGDIITENNNLLELIVVIIRLAEAVKRQGAPPTIPIPLGGKPVEMRYLSADLIQRVEKKLRIILNLPK